MCQKVRRIRKGLLRQEAVATEVSQIVIPYEQHFTIEREDQQPDEGETFYYEDSQLESKYRVIVFTTGDGTFDVAPKLMKQLYTILIIIADKCLPMLYAYLPNKKYEIFFPNIFQTNFNFEFFLLFYRINIRFIRINIFSN